MSASQDHAPLAGEMRGTTASQPERGAAHRPGPWTVGGNEHGYVRQYGGPAIYAVDGHFMVAETLRGDGREKANARLIAAAPEMLAALKHILAGALSLPRFAEDEARAAIAKATGPLTDGDTSSSTTEPDAVPGMTK